MDPNSSFEMEWIICINLQPAPSVITKLPNVYLTNVNVDTRVTTNIYQAQGYHYKSDARVAAELTGVVYDIRRRRDFRASTV